MKLTSLLAPCLLAASTSCHEVQEIMPGLYPNAITYSPGSRYVSYQSKLSDTADASSWIQIDLGDRAPTIRKIELYPAVQSHGSTINLPYMTYGFPVRYSIEVSNDEDFKDPTTIVDRTGADEPNPHDTLVTIRPSSKLKGGNRYLRLTATKFGPTPDGQHYLLALLKIAVRDGHNKDIAEKRKVTVDGDMGNQGRVSSDSGFLYDLRESDSDAITRPPRPEGEGIVKNNPQNIIRKNKWNPPKILATVPTTGVKLEDGIFRRAMENNIGYLLNDSMSTVDHLVQDFRQRAGKDYPDIEFPEYYWAELPGSNAGRWLMGAANTLRWQEHEHLRSRLEDVLKVIAECVEDDGYMVGYAKDTMFLGEHAAYSRSMLTHGLLDAAITGEDKDIYDLLRNFYDWYNEYEHLDKLQRGTVQGQQGMVANTRIARSSIGKPEDVYVIQQYFQENYWREGLAEGDKDLIWQYPYDRPHNYLATAVEPYMDLYMLTGDKRYHDMVRGYWNLIRDHWMYPGGVMSITEFGEYPPDSQLLVWDTGETCGNSFWVRINQRLHQLDPENESYAAEIERSIYNLFLANQDGEVGILYHTHLLGGRENNQGTGSAFGENINTCCEGQGTRTYGSLPEFIYSIGADDDGGGLYVNLFENADIDVSLNGRDATVSMRTEFPLNNSVEIKIKKLQGGARSKKAKIRIRVPGWATEAMHISVHGSSDHHDGSQTTTTTVKGKPGTYVTLDRAWSQGDTISFTLLADYRLTEYKGTTQVEGHRRYAIEYGPVLMALSGAPDNATVTTSGEKPEELFGGLRPIEGKPLHSNIKGFEEYTLMPYFHIEWEKFTCFPIVDLE